VGVTIAVYSVLAFGQVSVLTQHNDNARTGQNLNETVLNITNVNQSSFGKLFWRTVDGYIYTQPLYVPNLNIQGKVQNVVYVATQHNTVYAFDADDPTATAPLWQTNLGSPMPSQDICIVTGDTNPVDCPYLDINPEIGVTSTPVIDASTGIMYVVAKSKNLTDGSYHFKLHGLDIKSGAEVLGPVEIAGQTNGLGEGSLGGLITFDPTFHNQRPALLLLNGVIYVAFGSTGDIGLYHGWVISYSANNLQQIGIISVTPNGSNGGVWQSGQGLVGDANNNIYFVSADGDFDASRSTFGDSYVKLNGSGLTVSDYFTPYTQGSLYQHNVDLGSGGPMLLPGTSFLVGMGKDATFRVVDTQNMGHYNPAFDADVQDFTGTIGPFFSSPIYWNSPNNGPVVYLWGPGDTLKGYELKETQFQTTPVSQSTVLNSSGFANAAALSLSATGNLSGTGIIWTSSALSGSAGGSPVPGILRAFDASDLTHELWNSAQNLARDDVGIYAKFAPPTIANGKVYASSFSGQLQVYGLNPPSASVIRFAQVAAASSSSAQSIVSASYSAQQKAGNFNVAIIGWNDSTANVQSVSDSAGNTYALAAGPITGTNLRQSIYYAKNIVGGSNSVTVQFNQAASKPDLRILEYSGVATTNPLDVTTQASGSGNIADSGFATSTVPNVLIIGANTGQGNTTIVPGAPFTSRVISSPGSNIAEDRLVNIVGSYHAWAPLGQNGPWVMQMVAFRSATGTAPLMGNVNPSTGSVTGGTSVTITGANFAAGATLTFDGAAATNVVVVNGTTITASTPAHVTGAVTVTVMNPDTQSGTLANGFTYISATAPTISGVSPQSGPTAGGTPVTLTGSNFVTGATVSFGSVAATNVVVQNATTVTLNTPAQTLGTVAVTVRNPDDQSGILTNAFTYVAPPSVTGVMPNNGPVSGGTSVTILGSNFVTGASISFGSNKATGVTVLNSTTITATTPAHAVGAVTVTVLDPDNQSGSLASGFTFTTAVGDGITFIQKQQMITNGLSTSASKAFDSNVTVGNLIIAALTVGPLGRTFTCSDTLANSYVLAATEQQPSDSHQSYILYSVSKASGADAVTCTISGTATIISMAVHEYSGVSTLDEVVSTHGSGTAIDSGATATISTANELLFVNVGFSGSGNSVTPGKGYTTRANVVNGIGNLDTYTEDQVVFSTGSYRGTCTPNASNLWSAIIVTFAGPSAPPPTVTGVAPSSGPAAGGTSITITGNDFLTGATVTIGGTAGTSIIVLNATTITAITPAHAAGAVAITVTNPDRQQSTLANGFTYQAAPTISSVTPNGGPATGGTPVTISGTGFVQGATVAFGGTAGTNVVFVSADTITATTPPNAVGAVTVAVTNPDTQSGSLANGFTYTSVTEPTVTGVSPASGFAAGGTTVMISGTNFVSGATATFGGASASNVVVVTANSISAITPSHSSGAVAVTVTNPNSESGILSNGYTFVAAPSVSGTTPDGGPTAGGTTVLITGANFVAGATVSFGGNAATNVTVSNPTAITATTPAHAPGAVNVGVKNPDGQSGTLTNGYAFQVPPGVSGVSPANGPAAGGNAVTISGSNFLAGATVSFGGSAATNVVVVNATSISATTPSHEPGLVAVTVTNRDAQSATLTNAYSYNPAPGVSVVSPSDGLVTGGTAVTVTGSNFSTGATVSFGGTAATNVTVVNGNTITTTTPAHSAGAVTVTVTNPDAQTGTLPNGYTYNTLSGGITFIQKQQIMTDGSSTIATKAFDASVTAGDLLVVALTVGPLGRTFTCADANGNSYALAATEQQPSDSHQSYIYYAVSKASSTDTVTCTVSGTATIISMAIHEYTGVTTLDRTHSAHGVGTSVDSGSTATTTAPNELLFVDVGLSGSGKSVTAGSGYTPRTTVVNGIGNLDSYTEDRVVSTAAVYNGACTPNASNLWNAIIATFK